MKTLIGIVLDESSSMWCRKEEVLNGFNKFIEDQKNITDDSARLFLVKFHTKITVVHRGVPLEEVKPMTESEYQPQGSTALYDSIAQCVQIMDAEKTGEERAICVIMTDGEENCSQMTRMGDIRNIIKSHEQQNDWSFLYIGVEIAEWIKASGMRENHCYTGFTPQTPDIVREVKRVANDRHKLVLPGLPVNATVSNDITYGGPSQYLTNLGAGLWRSNHSEEMNALSAAISDYRSSESATVSDEDPFNSSR